MLYEYQSICIRNISKAKDDGKLTSYTCKRKDCTNIYRYSGRADHLISGNVLSAVTNLLKRTFTISSGKRWQLLSQHVYKSLNFLLI